MSRHPSSPMISMSARPRRSQRLPSQAEADGAPRAVAAVPSRLSVLLVADGTGSRQGGDVVLEGAAQRLLRAQSREGKMQDRLAHLPPQTLSLMGAAEPRSCLDRADRAEVLSSQVLHADGTPVHEDATGERPVVRATSWPCAATSTAPRPGPAAAARRRSTERRRAWTPGRGSPRRRAPPRRRARPRGAGAAPAVACGRQGRTGARTRAAPPLSLLSPRVGTRRTRHAGRRTPHRGWPSA